jgi:hypothetical protein
MDIFDLLGDEGKAQSYLIEQGSDEWRELRVGRFTGSEMFKLVEPGKREMTQDELKARPKTGEGSKTKQIQDVKVLGEKAWTYIYKKVAETLTGQLDEEVYAWPVLRGKEMEGEAVEFFEKRTGMSCDPVGFIPFTDHAGSSPDRMVSDGAVLEIKCPSNSKNQVEYLMLTDYFDLKREKPEYYWQIQTNILFTGAKKGYFATYDPRFKEEKHRMAILEVPIVPADHDLIIQKLSVATEEKLKIIKLIG